MTPAQRIATGVGVGAVALAAPLIVHFEGTVRTSYRDVGVGVITACTGHTGPDVKLGQVYTDAQCRDLLGADLAKHQAGLAKCMPPDAPAHVRAAFLSFAFNVGVGAACASTAMRRLRAGDQMGACANLSRWTYAGGKELPGLVRRRAAERALCEGRPVNLGTVG